MRFDAPENYVLGCAEEYGCISCWQWTVGWFKRAAEMMRGRRLWEYELRCTLEDQMVPPGSSHCSIARAAATTRAEANAMLTHARRVMARLILKRTGGIFAARRGLSQCYRGPSQGAMGAAAGCGAARHPISAIPIDPQRGLASGAFRGRSDVNCTYAYGRAVGEWMCSSAWIAHLQDVPVDGPSSYHHPSQVPSNQLERSRHGGIRANQECRSQQRHAAWSQ